MKNSLPKALLLLTCLGVVYQISAQSSWTNTFNAADRSLPLPIASRISKPTLLMKIGNVEIRQPDVCLKIQNPNLKIGEKVLIILPETPQKVLQAEIAHKGSCQKKGLGDLTNDNSELRLNSYSLKLVKAKASNIGLAIGVVGAVAKIRTAKGLVSFDLDNDKKDEYFRECTSNEGVHFTVWSGKPLIGKRIWHSYYHFDYDIEPTCKVKDYEDTQN